MNFETFALSILLFMVYFSSVSLLISTKSEDQKKENYPQLTYKEAFSPAYDPEPIVEPKSATTENSQRLCLPPRNRRHNQVAAVVNGVIITPPPKENRELHQQLPSIPNNVSIRQLRQIIKEYNLQAFVKKKLGKSVSKCRKDELIKILSRRVY